ncbi:golgin subfamily A member 2-like [Dipodomys merriami]|uniref:golgin subfamily A member 2-like n=1 Tax=Dipodomys merriami TaxID=94247 RepID=UPI003855CA92
MQLQKDLKFLEEQLHLQVEENQSLSLQSLEQQQRLWILEKKAEDWAQHAEDLRKILETMEKEQETLKHTLVHNCQLKEERALLQDAWQRMSAEKGELASILHTEQQEKTTLQAKLDELEEEFKQGKDMAEFKHQAAEDLQELHDMYLAQVQELSASCKQHRATNQLLMSEKEALQQHLLKQGHLMDQLKQEQVQNKLLAQVEREKLQDTLKCLEATRQENAQLRAQLSALAFPGKIKTWLEGAHTESCGRPPTSLQPADPTPDHHGRDHRAVQRTARSPGEAVSRERPVCEPAVPGEEEEEEGAEGAVAAPYRGEHRVPGHDAGRRPGCAADAHSDLSVPLKTEVREEQQVCEDVHLQENLKPVPGEAGAPGPLKSPTAEPPVPLLPAIQPQQEPTDGGEESCLPVFYKPKADDAFDIITI